MKLVILLFVLLFTPFVLAGGNITYTIIEEKVLVEMDVLIEENFEFTLPRDYSALEIDSESYERVGNNLFIPNSQNLKLKYITSSQIEKSGKEYFFISKETLHPGNDVRIYLPEGAVLLEKYIVFPKEYYILSDGHKIILEWKNSPEKELFIPYEYANSSNIEIYFIFLILVLILIYLFYEKQEKKKSVAKNLFKEERKIIDYLILKKECWTKEMVKDLGISKVRLSRKLRNLEEKGLIEKIPHGNENRIILKK